MRRIKIFLASSIADLRSDRAEVGDFIRRLDEIYLDRGVHFSLIKCDDYDSAIAAEGKQAQYDREIRGSELCLFLFFKKVGDYTRHEFEVALDAFQNSRKPKIVTYFKYAETPDEATGEVKAFMRMLDGELKHYYNVYQNIDTLKLGILMQIKLMKLDVEEPAVGNGKVMFGGIEIADTRNLPVFSGNQALTALKKRLEKVTKDYYELRERYRTDEGNDDLYVAFSEAASRKVETEQAIRNAERAVLAAARQMCENTAKRELSPRQVAAYRAFERGDYADALGILDLDAILSDMKHNEEMAEGYRECIDVNVNELLQRIEVLQADGVDRGKAEEIERIYEAVTERVERYGLEKGPLYDHAVFLWAQKDYARATEVAERFGYYEADPLHPVTAEGRASVKNLLGMLYGEMQRYAEAEEAFREAIGICERSVPENAAVFEPKLATGRNRLGDLYERMERYAEAEEEYRKAIGIRLRLASESAAFESDLAESCNSLGILYRKTHRYAEAEELYRRAIGICERLAKEAPAEFEPELASVCNNLGVLYRDTQRYSEAEEMHQRAIGIRRRLAEENPAKFKPELAESYSNLGVLYRVTLRYAEAEEAYRRAIGIYLQLAARSFEAFEPELAVGYNNLGVLYDLTGRSEAEEAYQKAIGLAEKYPQNEACIRIIELAKAGRRGKNDVRSKRL